MDSGWIGWVAATMSKTRALPLLAAVVTALVVVPAAAASTFHLSAIDQTGAEINVLSDKLLGTDVTHVYTGSIGSRSSAWTQGDDGVFDVYAGPGNLFLNFDLGCNPEEPEFFLTDDFFGPCWDNKFTNSSFPANGDYGGEWGEMLPLTATAADNSTPVVFDHWNVTNAGQMQQVYPGQSGGVPGYCTSGDRGVRSSVAFTGATYQSYLRQVSGNPSLDRGTNVQYQGVYAAASPDSTAPLVTIAPLLDCSTFVQNSTQVASYSCTDPGFPSLTGPTGVASCVGNVDGVPVASGANLPTDALVHHTLTVTAKDAAGNKRTQTASYRVVPPTLINSANHKTFTAGVAGEFVVNATGFTLTSFPIPVLSEDGALPDGVTFVDNHNGSAGLAGTPADGTAGTYPITITAASSANPSASSDNTTGYPPVAVQNFVLTVATPVVAPAAFVFKRTPSISTAGQPTTVTITAKDGGGNTMTSYAGSPTWSDTAGEVSGSPQAFVDGVSTNTVTFGAAHHAEQITVTDGGVSATTAKFDVLGPLAGFKVNVTRPVFAGAPAPVHVTAVDSLGNTIRTYSGSPALADTAGHGAGSLGSFTNGVSTGTMTFDQALTGDQVSVTDGGVSSQSSTFNVIGPVDHFQVAPSGPFVAGSPFAVKVIALDALGRRVTNYAGAPTWTDTSGQIFGSLPGSFAAGVDLTQPTLALPYSKDRITVTDGAVTTQSRAFTITP